MTYLRTPYDDASSPHDMATDSRAVELAMHLPQQVARLAQGALDAVPAAAPAPVKRAGIAVSDAAAKLASRFLD